MKTALKRKIFGSDRWNRFKRFCVLVGILTLPFLSSCSKSDTQKRLTQKPTKTIVDRRQAKTKLPKIQCYDYKDKVLRVYVEDKPKRKGQELGSEYPLHFSKIGINKKGDSEPLAYFCTNNGHLFWVTADTVYIKKISFENQSFRVTHEFKEEHTYPDEHKDEYSKEHKGKYSKPRVISADILRSPDLHWRNIPVATLTDTGIFQVARYSPLAMARGKPDRAIVRLRHDNDIDVKNRWPAKGVAGGVVHVLSSKEFSVIPLGVKGEGEVRNFYYIALVKGEVFRSRNWVTATMTPWKRNPELHNIFKITKPVRWDEESGGDVVNFLFETKDAKVLQLFKMVTPDDETKKQLFLKTTASSDKY